MFQLLQPFWLFSAAAIIIPVVIHLWNIREGKTLQVGSILFIQESARQQARSLKLKDILLLILRCLLIIAFAFLLSKPTWQKQLTTTKEKGWLLIEKQSVQGAYSNYKSTIDSLIKAGYKFHYFNQGFEAAKFEDAIKTTDGKVESNVSYWALLNQLNEQVPSELPVYLFTDNKLKRFAGTRPEVSINLKWLTYNSTDIPRKSLFTAFKTLSKNIRVVVAESKPSITYYAAESATNNNKYNVSASNGKLFVASKDTATNSVEVDTSSINIKIYTDQFNLDAGYLLAAINAIQQYTSLPIKASIINNINELRQDGNWLFWLSEKPLPKQSLSTNVFVYEKGKDQNVHSTITEVNGSSLNQPAVAVSKIIPSNQVNNNEIFWKDGLGHQLLTFEKSANNIYRFNSRFNPEWSDLTWNNQFVEMIFHLLIKEDLGLKDFDNRVIDAAQMQPIALRNKGFDKEKFVETIGLSKVFWLIAFVLFCLERYLSLTLNKQEAYG